LIEDFASTLSDDEYLDALSAMIDAAKTAKQAREEELAAEMPDDDDPDPDLD